MTRRADERRQRREERHMKAQRKKRDEYMTEPTAIVGYFIWEHGGAGPTYYKIEKGMYDSSQVETTADRKRKLIHRYDLNGALFDQRIDDLARFFPMPPPKAPEPVPELVTKLSMWTRLQKVKLDNKDGHLIQIEGLAESFNVGIVNLSPGWVSGARVYWSLELRPNDSVAVSVELPKAPPTGTLVVNAEPVTEVKAIGARYSFETGGASPVYDQTNAD